MTNTCVRPRQVRTGSLTDARDRLALTPTRLVAPLDGPVRWYLVWGLAAVLASPFLSGPTAYVLGQYHLFLGKLMVSSRPDPGRWADLTSLLLRPLWARLGRRRWRLG